MKNASITAAAIFFAILIVLIPYNLILSSDPLRYMSEKDINHILVKKIIDDQISLHGDHSERTVILGGSSSSMGLGGEHSGNVINLSVWGSSPFEAKEILKKYIQIYGKPSRILVMFNYAPLIYRDNWLPRISLKHNWLNIRQITNFLWNSNNNLFDLTKNTSLYSKALLNISSTAIDNFQNGIWKNDYLRNHSLLLEFTKSNGTAIFPEKGPDIARMLFRGWQSYLNNTFTYHKEHIRGYKELIAYIGELKIKTSLLIPPKSSILRNKESQLFLNTHELMLTNLAHTQNEIHFSQLPLFWDAKYFSDNFHLNKNGRHKLNSIVGL